MHRTCWAALPLVVDTPSLPAYAAVGGGGADFLRGLVAEEGGFAGPQRVAITDDVGGVVNSIAQGPCLSHGHAARRASLGTVMLNKEAIPDGDGEVWSARKILGQPLSHFTESNDGKPGHASSPCGKAIPSISFRAVRKSAARSTTICSPSVFTSMSTEK